MQLELPLNIKTETTEIVLPPWHEISNVIVSISGGRDSTCCLLWALENVPDRSKIECWHHLVDGEAEDGLMDWNITKDYVKKLAAAFDLPIYYSWLSGGIEGEILRLDRPRTRTFFETPDGLKFTGGNGKNNSRMRFPAKSPDLRIRWCSSSAKIDPCKASLANQERFNGKNIVVITGERRAESPKRQKYKKCQYYCQPNSKRTVYQYRPILDCSDAEIWAKLESYRIAAYPAYHLGWSRTSCMNCIFNCPNGWATIARDFNERFERIAKLEEKLNHTIDRDYSVRELAERGRAYTHDDSEMLALAKQSVYERPIFIDDWYLPIGADVGK